MHEYPGGVTRQEYLRKELGRLRNEIYAPATPSAR